MILTSSNFSRHSSKFNKLKAVFRNSELEPDRTNDRYQSRYITLNHLYDIGLPIIEDSGWSHTASCDFQVNPDGATGVFIVKVKLSTTSGFLFKRDVWIEDSRSVQFRLYEGASPSPQWLEGTFTYIRRTILAGMLDVVTTEAADKDGNDIQTMLNSFNQERSVIEMASDIVAAIQKADSVQQLDYLKAFLEELKGTESKSPLVDRFLASVSKKRKSLTGTNERGSKQAQKTQNDFTPSILEETGFSELDKAS